MVTFNCVDCGQPWESKVRRPWVRRCKVCAEKARKAGRGPLQERKRAHATAAVSVRELKANASQLLRRLAEQPGGEIAITRHGKPCARLVAVTGAAQEPAPPPGERVSLRGIYANRHQLSDADFQAAKGIWEPRVAT